MTRVESNLCHSLITPLFLFLWLCRSAICGNAIIQKHTICVGDEVLIWSNIYGIFTRRWLLIRILLPQSHSILSRLPTPLYLAT